MTAARRVAIPPEALYWGLIPSDRVGSGPKALAYAFEHLLPRPVDGMQLAATRLPDGTHLVTGIPADALRRLLAEDSAAGPGTWEAIPAGTPAHLAELPEDCLARLNLLHGDFEPLGRRRWRRALAVLVLAALAAVAALAFVGVRARVRTHDREAAALRAERNRRIDATLVRVDPDGAPNLPPSQRLLQALRRLDGAPGDGAVDETFSAELVLDALWQRWPRELRLQVESVAVSPDRLTVRGAAPDAGAAERLARALGAFEAADRSWRTGDPDVHEYDGGFRFVITARGVVPEQETAR